MYHINENLYLGLVLLGNANKHLYLVLHENVNGHLHLVLHKNANRHLHLVFPLLMDIHNYNINYNNFFILNINF